VKLRAGRLLRALGEPALIFVGTVAVVVGCVGAGQILSSGGWGSRDTLFGSMFLAAGSIALASAAVLRRHPERAGRSLGWSPLHNSLSGLAFAGCGVVTLRWVGGTAEVVLVVASVLCMLASFAVLRRDRQKIAVPP
jgi:hypothetical protein